MVHLIRFIFATFDTPLIRRNMNYAGLVLIAGALEFFSIFSIVPVASIHFVDGFFENLLLRIDTTPFIGFAFQKLNILRDKFFFTLLLVIFLLAVSLFKFYVNKYMLMLGVMVESHICKARLLSHLHRPLRETWMVPPSDAVSKILHDSAVITNEFVMPLYVILLNVLMGFGVCAAIVYVFPGSGLLFLSVAVLFVIAISKLASAYVGRLGEQRVAENQARYSSVVSTVNNLRMVRATNSEKPIFWRFCQLSDRYALTMAAMRLVLSIPRLSFEAILYVGVLVILATVDLKPSAELGAAAVGLVVAVFRLLPVASQLASALVKIRGAHRIAERFETDLTYDKPTKNEPRRTDCEVVFEHEINLNNISFRYPEHRQDLLTDLNYKFQFAQWYLIEGKSGSGKSTILNLISGIIEAQAGDVSIDGVDIGFYAERSLVSFFAYSGQETLIMPGTIQANICCDLAVNADRLRTVVSVACLENWLAETAEGLDTLISENAASISGGQKQRIGLARCLYHSKGVLLLDEATSSVDMDTEAAIFKRIRQSGLVHTVIAVSHSKSIRVFFDKVLQLNNNGQLKVL